MKQAEIYQYDNCVIFHPIVPSIEKKLVIYEKSIIRNNIEVKKMSLLARQDRGGKECGITYQGFFTYVVAAYVESGYIPIMHDDRVSNERRGTFETPDMSLAYGLRFRQRELLEEGLMKNSSGLIGAPTRYGKTPLIVNTLRVMPNCTTCVIAPGVDLVNQLYYDITEKFGLPGRRVHLCHGSKKVKGALQKGDVVVCSVDSLQNLSPGDYDLVIADEPHALVSDSRIGLVDSFTKARRIGFGATLHGRFDGRDKLITGIFGPILAERTYLEAVEEGAICPLNIIFLDIEVSPKNYRDRNQAYNAILFKNKTIASIVEKMCNSIIPAEWQTLIFIRHEPQALMLRKAIGEETTVAMAKSMTDAERAEVTELLRTDKVKRCLCSRIYVQGVTFSDVRVLINAEAGGNNTSAIQKPGRLAEVRPNKKCGIVIDFAFKPMADVESKNGYWMAPIRDSQNRETAYREKGYGIYHVSNLDQLAYTISKLT